MIKKITLALIPIFTSFYLVFAFHITSIECLGKDISCSKETTDLLKTVELSNYLSTKTHLKKVLSESPYINSYYIRLKFPSTLLVFVVEKAPFGFLVRNGEYYAIDSNGIVLGKKTEAKGFPLEIEEDISNSGTVLSKEKVFALESIKRLSQICKLTKAVLKKEYLEVTIKENRVFYLPLLGDQELLTGAVISIDNRLNKTQENTIIVNDTKLLCENGCIIDLRFKNPVIRAS